MEATTTITTLEPILEQHPFLQGLSPRHRHQIVECASNMRFNAGEYLFREGEEATHFYLIRRGLVALELAPPDRPALVVQTVGEGEVIGWSWFLPPYRWQSGAQAVQLTRAIAFDAACVRRKCEHDHSLGYQLVMQFAGIAESRLTATRLQLLDVYGAS